jgi:hypothetical protein
MKTKMFLEDLTHTTTKLFSDVLPFRCRLCCLVC